MSTRIRVPKRGSTTSDFSSMLGGFLSGMQEAELRDEERRMQEALRELEERRVEVAEEGVALQGEDIALRREQGSRQLDQGERSLELDADRIENDLARIQLDQDKFDYLRTQEAAEIERREAELAQAAAVARNALVQRFGMSRSLVDVYTNELAVDEYNHQQQMELEAIRGSSMALGSGLQGAQVLIDTATEERTRIEALIQNRATEYQTWREEAIRFDTPLGEELRAIQLIQDEGEREAAFRQAYAQARPQQADQWQLYLDQADQLDREIAEGRANLQALVGRAATGGPEAPPMFGGNGSGRETLGPGMSWDDLSPGAQSEFWQHISAISQEAPMIAAQNLATWSEYGVPVEEILGSLNLTPEGLMERATELQEAMQGAPQVSPGPVAEPAPTPRDRGRYGRALKSSVGPVEYTPDQAAELLQNPENYSGTASLTQVRGSAEVLRAARALVAAGLSRGEILEMIPDEKSFPSWDSSGRAASKAAREYVTQRLPVRLPATAAGTPIP